MTIYSRVIKAMVDFEVQTGKRPTFLYAGETEMDQLKARASLGGSVAVEPGKLRNTVGGLQIVEVKEKDFLSAGIQV